MISETAGLPTEAAASSFEAAARELPDGYAALARLRAAAAHANSGQVNSAAVLYDQIVADLAVESSLRDLARIKAGYLLIGDASVDDLRARLQPVMSGDHQLRNLAREILGFAAYRASDVETARQMFEQIVADAAATPGLRDRGAVMLALLPSATAVGIE